MRDSETVTKGQHISEGEYILRSQSTCRRIQSTAEETENKTQYLGIEEKSMILIIECESWICSAPPDFKENQVKEMVKRNNNSGNKEKESVNDH